MRHSRLDCSFHCEMAFQCRCSFQGVHKGLRTKVLAHSEPPAQVAMQNLKVPSGGKPLYMSFRSQGQPYLANPNAEMAASLQQFVHQQPVPQQHLFTKHVSHESKVAVPAGAVAIGFGKGKWVQAKTEDDIDVTTDAMFLVQSLDQAIILENAYSTIEKALATKVEKRVQYHKLADVPGQPGKYNVTQDWRRKSEFYLAP